MLFDEIEDTVVITKPKLPSVVKQKPVHSRINEFENEYRMENGLDEVEKSFFMNIRQFFTSNLVVFLVWICSILVGFSAALLFFRIDKSALLVVTEMSIVQPILLMITPLLISFSFIGFLFNSRRIRRF